MVKLARESGLTVGINDELWLIEVRVACGVASAGNDPRLKTLDEMLAKALAARPGEVPLFMAFDNDRPLMTVTTGPSPEAPEEKMTVQLWDRSNGEAVMEPADSLAGPMRSPKLLVSRRGVRSTRCIQGMSPARSEWRRSASPRSDWFGCWL